jgi:hypothetical protein
MPIPTYTPGYPPDGSSLGQTKSVIRNNLDGTFETLGIDHVNNNGVTNNNLTGNPAGYHNIAHFVPQGADPAAIAGYGQLYSKTIDDETDDQALFWETGGGLIQQLTVNVTPSPTPNGYSFLPGGLIIQWGSVASPGTDGTVDFPLEFPSGNPPFSIVLTSKNSSASSGAITVNTSPAVTAAQFTYRITSSSDALFYWMAIGN